MDRLEPNSDLPPQAVDEAAQWFVELSTEDIGPQARVEFDTWLRRSPDHLRAYLEMFALWDDSARVDARREESAEELIALALRDRNVVEFGSAIAATAPSIADRTQVRAVRWYAGIAASFVLSAGAALYWHAFFKDVYTTDVGEQRVIALSDGSSIELNARSKLKVRFAANERRIDLLRGQALFTVAKQAARPFVVNSADTRVRAVGTQFDVYQKDVGTTVTVVQGRVAITQAQRTHDEVLVAAGEQVTVKTASVDRPRRPDVAAATSWRQHRLIFSAAPLREVVEEFNRYNERPLVLLENGATAFDVSGNFSVTDVPSLLRFLRAQPGVIVEERAHEIRIAVN